MQFENIVISLDAKGTRQLHMNGNFEAGDFVLLVGQNGSGKTSILDLIAGIRQQSSGLIKGVSYNSNRPIAYAVQDPHNSLLPWLSVVSNILLPSRLVSVEDNQKSIALEFLKRFGLDHRATDYPYRLSGGEKQAINLIRTICTPASIRLFDEVTASLHSSFKRVARDVLSTTNDNKYTFFVSHDISDLVLPFNRFFAIKDEIVEEVTKSHAEEIMAYV